MKQQAGWGMWQRVKGLLALLRSHHEDVPPHLRKPVIRRRGRTTELQFARGVGQSRMLAAEPDRLLIDYTRTMMGALLLVPRPSRIGMVGLGGGSQAKFCYRHLPEADVEVMENNPHVIALRKRFRVPDDDARFRIVPGDAARLLQERCGRYDLLLVDGYDETGIPEALSTQRFYDDCRDSLATNGALAINLYCKDPQPHIEKLRRSFGKTRVAVVEEIRQSNRVAFAWVGTPAVDEVPALSPAGCVELAAEFVRLRGLGRRSRG
ncbi:fused MFS/spermidine synthase [Marilutibacter alkalisoli]|uniref:Transferase n=1 Tax=Marilutibacter alkalisoli TaxID=2591633 RepID=A0A514BSJ0_9GAMM|nr:fused MFS/spermidine synthase [Lysobacter alkalisoli]QDH70285.1 transferase [Lysobacter alkalisoli]